MRLIPKDNTEKNHNKISSKHGQGVQEGNTWQEELTMALNLQLVSPEYG